jgi:hypothetical protein
VYLTAPLCIAIWISSSPSLFTDAAIYREVSPGRTM